MDTSLPLRSAGPARGVLRTAAPDGCLAGNRVLPPPALAPFVHHFWSLRWDLRSPFTAEALPHPSARIFLEETEGAPRAQFAGVYPERFTRRLEGQGQTFGIAFRAAMAQPLLGRPMVCVTGRVVPLTRVLGRSVEPWARAILAARDLETKVALASDFLASRVGSAKPRVVRLRDLVERMGTDRSLLRIEQVCAASGLGARALQRAFSRYVGMSPKSVLRRYRLLEASEQLRGRRPPSLAALATSLGYADQAHFARDFKLTVGRSPGAFARSTR
jgi:AraC-like DNA-binding protein